MDAEKQLEILHDHYKETFARIREVERSRDRLFLWLIGLFALLILEIGYPAAVGGSLGTVSIGGAEFNLQALPLPALLNATWVLTLAIALRYCQTTIFVSRQYPYLHLLEDNISPLIRGVSQAQGKPSLQVLDSRVYRREGEEYLSQYPLLLDVAWFAYTILFPVIVIFATVALAAWDWTMLPYPVLHRIFDLVIAGAIIICFFLYRGAAFLRRVLPRRSQEGARRERSSGHR